MQRAEWQFPTVELVRLVPPARARVPMQSTLLFSRLYLYEHATQMLHLVFRYLKQDFIPLYILFVIGYYIFSLIIDKF